MNHKRGGKAEVDLKIRSICGVYESCKGILHYRGYMHARQTHLDLGTECDILSPLRELARIHGVRLRCINTNECIVIEIEQLNLSFEICADNSPIKCKEKIYIYITKSGNLYIGPVFPRS